MAPTIVSLAQRARRNPKKLIAGNTGDLRFIPSWQNPLFANWPGFTDLSPEYAYVTESEVLDLPVVSGFFTITTSLLLQMPLHAYLTVDPEQAQVVPDPPVIANPVPGPGRVFGDCIGEYLRDIVLYGNYVAILGPPGPDGWPEFLTPVPAGYWSVTANDIEGTYVYTINGREYTPAEIFHIKVNVCSGQLVGRGLLALFPRLIASSVAAERWANMYFEGGAVPPGVLKHPNPELTQAQALDLKQKLKSVAQSRDWAVLPGGTELDVFDTNADEAQLNETRKLNDQHLAMALGIPGALLGLDSPSLTYRNITDVFQQFLTTTVMGYLVPFEQQIGAQCLPREMQARFSQANVLRPDLAQRVELAAKTVQAGLFSPDEARAAFDLGAQPTQIPEVKPVS